MLESKEQFRGIALDLIKISKLDLNYDWEVYEGMSFAFIESIGYVRKKELDTVEFCDLLNGHFPHFINPFGDRVENIVNWLNNNYEKRKE